LRAALLAAALAPAAAGAQDAARSDTTADHERFEILKGPFASGEEVTKACLSCHTEAADQMKGSIHWSWTFEHPETGQTLGKRQVVNSFCGNVASNEVRCTSCHAGYGWDRIAEAPPAQETAVDCLICHDRSGTYTKLDNAAGHPPLDPVPPKAKTITGAVAQPVTLSLAAQSVGAPGRDNCGQCHFNGGGGDNVKHGDLSTALLDPTPAVDVHMSAEGAGFTCATCHQSRAHVWPGSRYAVHASDPEGQGRPGFRRDVATCESCHGNAPHPAASIIGVKLNDHVDAVACQSCHIPAFARGGVATKTLWDWSTAGRLEDGKPIMVEGYTQGDGRHRDTYLSTKGDFAWGEDVIPHYAWFDGQMRYTLTDMTIDPAQRVEINSFGGAPHDGRSRIWPFKRMEGRQPYDAKNLTLVYTQVYGPDTDTALWTNFDWAKAIQAGMDYVGKPYSGEFGFVDTHMYWPITHMVAPAEQAVRCAECHAPEGGRLAGVPGLRMPGAQPARGIVDMIGLALVAAAALGVLGHAALRVIAARKGGGHD
jgi:octaheme c-type cytochrome (tetrathionate reductase family)